MGSASTAPQQIISLPKGGGALHGIGEKFSPDLYTGTGNFTVPIALPPGRNGFQPQVNLVYSTGNPNGYFGLGWSLSIPGVSRKTSHGVPRYQDAAPHLDERDTFILSGAEDLVPIEETPTWTRYQPRTEGLFARIIHHHEAAQQNDYWEVRSKDGLISTYGTPGKRGIKDPAAIGRDAEDKFAWKLIETSDPFGNRIVYTYAADEGNNGSHVWKQPRLECIQYADFHDNGLDRFLISVTFEYEDEVRPDPFSDYRAGFEIRTTHRCKAITIETHFDETRPTRSYHFHYDNSSANGVSLLTQVDVAGYTDAKQLVQELPPLTFGYTQFEPQGRKFFPVTGEELPAYSLANPNLELVDLNGDGLPDILEMNGTVRYWRNAGRGQYDLPRPMQDAPPYALAESGVQMMDANGDGRVDLLVTNGQVSGYYPLRFDGIWNRLSFQPYPRPPSVNFEDSEVKLVDLDGDGITDVIRSGSRFECFFNDRDRRKAWQRTRLVERKALEVFPNVNFSDPRVKWADMTGDGLQDIVLVYDGNIEYWPNLGHGDWGKRIHMRNSPRFQDDGYTFGYDPRRILIGDVDGDGLADIVYVGNGRVFLWMNQNGNSWSDRIEIAGTPTVTGMDSVRLVDLMGTGVNGVLWSADANGFGVPHLFFLDFTGGVKPYLLNEMDNHLGAATRVEYQPSIYFYLEDRKSPKTRWRTYLPFPVQVVARVEVIDEISRGKLTTEFSYHHGYWDGDEREFRGFGMVEQRDTETFEYYHSPGLHGEATQSQPVEGKHFSPPLLTRTWFHQGPIEDASGEWHELGPSAEWWQEDPPLLGHNDQINAFLACLTNQTTLLARRDRRHALRTLRGSILRSELYALDGSKREGRPYTVTEYLYGLREESPPVAACEDRPRIFFPHALAQRTTQWERGDEPMTQFSFTSDYDQYGQPRSQTSIAVPRRRDPMQTIAPGAPGPQPYLTTHTVTDHAQRDDGIVFIVDRVARATTYDIHNDGRAAILDLRRTIESKALDDAKAIINQTVNYYDGSPFVGLCYQQIDLYGALVRTEQLVLTEDILQQAYDNERPPYLNPAGGVNWPNVYPTGFRTKLASLAGYLYYDGRAKPEHAQGYFAVTAQCEYDFHRSPNGNGGGLILTQRDPLGQETKIEYEYQLLPNRLTDAANLTTKAQYNYRLMQPRSVTDPNGNTTEFWFTPIGLVSQSFLRDKNDTGDSNNPSTQFTYDFLAYECGRQGGNPNPPAIAVRTLRRIHHDGEVSVAAGEGDETIEMHEYSDGFGRLVQTRTQAEDVIFGEPIFGDSLLPADQADLATTQIFTGTLNADHQDPNVVVNGWQVYDNKGRVVEKYEPFFDKGWNFAPPTNTQLGQKIEMYYDPRGKVIRTLNPDGSEQRVIYGVPGTKDAPNMSDPHVFDPTPWEVYTYDANDLAPLSHAPDGTPLTARAPSTHWYTPSSIEIDALGRAVKAVQRLSQTSEIVTHSAYDIRGNLLSVTDALGRLAFAHEYDLANRVLKMFSIDAGARHSIFDAAGNPIEHRDRKGALVLSAFDKLNRPTHLWARNEAGLSVTLRQRVIYGDDVSGTVLTRVQLLDRNLFGQPYRHYDEAGLLQFDSYDFKGNLVQKSRQVIRDTSIANNWQANWDAQGSPNALEPTNRAYQTNFSYDALNRPKEITYPKDINDHRSILKTIYNRAGALEKVELDGAPYVERIVYDAKGQRALVAYGNGVMTRYAYDPQSFRLARLRTEAYTHPALLSYRPNGGLLQDFAYEYDLAGNIVQITAISPGCGVRNNPDASCFPALSTKLAAGDALVRRFAYDPIYRLIEATGRQAAQQSVPCTDYDPRRAGYNWSGQAGTPLPDNARDVTQLYTEQYAYDPAGNMLSSSRSGSATCYLGMSGFTPKRWQDKVNDFLAGGAPDWGTDGNRLTNVGAQNQTQTHHFDANGNLVQENTERHFTWDHADHLIGFRNQPTPTCPASVEARYLYDARGMRVKKWVQTNGTGIADSTVSIDGIFEYSHWKKVGQADQSNNHLHVMDNQDRIALVRVGTKHPDDGGPDVQYHLGDHLGGSNVVIGGQTVTASAFINHEEYFPYGDTSFGCFAKKRYRFTGKERDEESGLYYHGARYYASWLARWVSCDPIWMADSQNLFQYVKNRPTVSIDPSGTQGQSPQSPDLPPPPETMLRNLQTNPNITVNPTRDKEGNLTSLEVRLKYYDLNYCPYLGDCLAAAECFVRKYTTQELFTVKGSDTPGLHLKKLLYNPRNQDKVPNNPARVEEGFRYIFQKIGREGIPVAVVVNVVDVDQAGTRRAQFNPGVNNGIVEHFLDIIGFRIQFNNQKGIITKLFSSDNAAGRIPVPLLRNPDFIVTYNDNDTSIVKRAVPWDIRTQVIHDYHLSNDDKTYHIDTFREYQLSVIKIYKNDLPTMQKEYPGSYSRGRNVFIGRLR